MFEFQTQGDEKVCELCDAAGGRVADTAEDLPQPPLHDNCRCDIVDVGDRMARRTSQLASPQDISAVNLPEFPDQESCVAAHMKKGMSKEDAMKACGHLKPKQSSRKISFSYQAMFEPYEEQGRHLAKIHVIDLAPNLNKWQVSATARAKALKTLLDSPLLGPPPPGEKGNVIGGAPGSPHEGLWSPVGKFIDFESNHVTHGIAEITKDYAWQKIQSGEWDAVSPSVLAFVEHREGDVSVVDDFNFEHVLFVDKGAYPEAGVESTYEARGFYQALAAAVEKQDQDVSIMTHAVRSARGVLTALEERLENMQHGKPVAETPLQPLPLSSQVPEREKQVPENQARAFSITDKDLSVMEKAVQSARGILTGLEDRLASILGKKPEPESVQPLSSHTTTTLGSSPVSNAATSPSPTQTQVAKEKTGQKMEDGKEMNTIQASFGDASFPDECFAYVPPEAKGADGKKSLRSLPYKNADGSVDLGHLRNALARFNQTEIPSDEKAGVLSKLCSAASKAGIDSDFCKEHSSRMHQSKESEQAMENNEIQAKVTAQEAELTTLRAYKAEVEKKQRVAKVQSIVELKTHCGMLEPKDHAQAYGELEKLSADALDAVEKELTAVQARFESMPSGPKAKHTGEQAFNTIEDQRQAMFGYRRDEHGEIIGGKQ